MAALLVPARRFILVGEFQDIFDLLRQTSEKVRRFHVTVVTKYCFEVIIEV